MNTGKNNTGAKRVHLEHNATTASTVSGQYGTGKALRKKKKTKSHANGQGNNKVWIAALAGASAGVIAGLLMAPESGKDTIDGLRRSAMRLGDQLDNTFRVAMDKLEDMGLTRAGDSLQVQGHWDTVKGKMKSQYGDLTDQDLTYVEGKEDELLGNLGIKLGKSKRELVRWINGLV
ncbi:YtxH domain-containing protein [Adhaeribacter soli]|uniref:CsbD family protein n=1 Tax=Adhaeribacter soli TaxID=2607655 RepID=A0A5N1IS56_9BACT|nr:CsbD family protein [Adhaeribacter soli]KAA9327339.1 CsbD family protein [Adhaeribacter soli]